jgi:acetylornithine deacetylase/succinyl-diaminopimelate desuccinylase-like protein
MSHIQHWIYQNQERIQRDYFTFLRFKSIGTDPACSSEMLACAEWVKDYLQTAGLQSQLIKTSGHPIVWGEYKCRDPHAHTLLIYGHYDVQPVDPIELWESDPFEPQIRGTQVYARGALDDKGQIFYAMLAALAFKELDEQLPINLKFCIEGEEESGSLGFSLALPDLKNRLDAHSLLVPDFDLFSREEPAISLGARGIATIEITLTGSKMDLHSGSFGGIAYNPNRALVQLLAELWDTQGRVQVPGFYDNVECMTKEDLKNFSFPGTRAEYKQEFGIEALGGEQGCSMMEANWFRPTLEINGIVGGYAGPGFKTVIPAQASAKLSCRLVPNQDPAAVADLVGKFLQKRVVSGMDLQYRVLSAEKAFRGRADSKLAQALSGAYEEVMGKHCHCILSGGSIPIIARLQEMTNVDVVGMGYGLADDQIHAPNEHFDMQRLCKGIVTVFRTIQRLK